MKVVYSSEPPIILMQRSSNGCVLLAIPVHRRLVPGSSAFVRRQPPDRRERRRARSARLTVSPGLSPSQRGILEGRTRRRVDTVELELQLEKVRISPCIWS